MITTASIEYEIMVNRCYELEEENKILKEEIKELKKEIEALKKDRDSLLGKEKEFPFSTGSYRLRG